MNLSENLKKIRKDNNLSQEQLAEKLGVSRQSVSKWESNQAYPEMDKMLQICQLFNLNIDELLNQDYKEVNNTKQAKNNVNKFIDSFLDYITKTIDMFSSIKLKDKIKCICEQIIIICILALIFTIIGAIFNNIIRGLIISLPDSLYYTIKNILESIYLIICLILGVILILHIFKVRYLDYYIIVKNTNNESIENSKEVNTESKKENQELKKETSKIIEKEQAVIKERKEKIIIRDPKHSEYKFISGLLKLFLTLIKVIMAFIAILFCLSFIILIIASVISLVFIKTGLLFVGTFITLLSCIVINLIILIILYNFITSKKNKSNKLALSFIISLITIGIGIGLIFIGISEFQMIEDINNENYIKEEISIPMNNDMILEDWHGYIEFVESDNNDIKIVYQHSKYNKIELTKGYSNNNYYYFDNYYNFENEMDIIRQCIDDINNKKIINYSIYKISIYTNKENIEILKKNRVDYFNQESLLQETINEYENKINEYENIISEKNLKINDLEEQIANCEISNYYD